MAAKRRKPLESRLKNIQMIVMDVDGVLTDGRIVYDDRGHELKFFDVQDGYGISKARSHGLTFAIISGRNSAVVSLRAKKTGIKEVVQGELNKLSALQQMLKKYDLQPEHICYIGDDELDLPVLQIAGVSVAPPNAVAVVRRAVDFITERSGGHGAVREVIDRILHAQGCALSDNKS